MVLFTRLTLVRVCAGTQEWQTLGSVIRKRSEQVVGV